MIFSFLKSSLNTQVMYVLHALTVFLLFTYKIFIRGVRFMFNIRDKINQNRLITFSTFRFLLFFFLCRLIDNRKKYLTTKNSQKLANDAVPLAKFFFTSLTHSCISLSLCSFSLQMTIVMKLIEFENHQVQCKCSFFKILVSISKFDL